nr:AAA family ATPase [Micromonospora sp. DSM 115978]
MRTRAVAMAGRDREVDTLRRMLSRARAGQGGTVFLVGEAGIGRSRLAAVAAQLAVAADMTLLRGRGSAIGPMVPFRSLSEALLSLTRATEPVPVEQLGPYRPILGRLIPEWGAPDAGAEPVSLVVLAEGVLRLTGLAGRRQGCLLVLDDLQHADAETLAVLEYLVDNVGGQPTAVVGTIRAESCPALDLARAAAQRGDCVLIELDRLDEADLRVLTGSCLGGGPEAVPDEVARHVWANSAGNPFLAEELVSGMIDAGLLVRVADRWRVTGALQTNVPAAFARRLAQRLDGLDPPERELLAVAAVLGRRFPVSVLQAVTGMDDRQLLRHLHGGLVAELVAPDDQTPDWYAFGHPMTVEALLGLLTPAQRARLARAAADAVELVHPGLPGEWCQIAALLRLDAGDRTGAGRLLAEAGQRALHAGAADSAVRLLDQARELVADDDTALAGVLESVFYALAEAGQIERALTSVGALDGLGAGLDRRRRAALHTRLAWAANIAGRSADGLAQIDVARRLLGTEATAEESAPVDVVAAHLVLDLPGPDQLELAEQMARRAATVAERVPQPIVACQAWQLLGALVRARDPDEATACLERARSIAVEHRLPIWEIHSLVRLGNDDAVRDGDLDRLEQARQVANRSGAVTAGYQAESSLALQVVLCGDFTSAAAIVDPALAATSRLNLLETVEHLLLTRAIAAGHQGRRREMESVLAEVRRRDGNPAQHGPKVYGLARAFCALLEENRPRALEELARAFTAEQENPTIFPLTGRHGLRLLLVAVDGTADRDEHRSAMAAPAGRLRWNHQFGLLADAVLAGRDGDRPAAESAVEEALRVARPYAMSRHLGLRLVGEAALADGWGDPVRWLRAAEEYFHGADVPAVASACRALLRRAGVPVTQRRDGAEEIPAALRSAGVTVREYEILRLLIDRLGNREIADRLHLSPRTVEKHVARLIAKTGQPDRIALSELASATVRG